MNINRFPRGGWLLAATLLSFGHLPPALGNDSASGRIHTSSTNSSIYSDILHDGENWTMLPHGSVLHMPEEHQSKIGDHGPVGNLVSWHEFLEINGDWLRAEEVTLRQAEGTKPIDWRRLQYFKKQKCMIVAVHEGSPIAVVFLR